MRAPEARAGEVLVLPTYAAPEVRVGARAGAEFEGVKLHLRLSEGSEAAIRRTMAEVGSAGATWARVFLGAHDALWYFGGWPHPRAAGGHAIVGAAEFSVVSPAIRTGGGRIIVETARIALEGADLPLKLYKVALPGAPAAAGLFWARGRAAACQAWRAANPKLAWAGEPPDDLLDVKEISACPPMPGQQPGPAAAVHVPADRRTETHAGPGASAPEGAPRHLYRVQAGRQPSHGMCILEKELVWASGRADACRRWRALRGLGGKAGDEPPPEFRDEQLTVLRMQAHLPPAGAPRWEAVWYGEGWDGVGTRVVWVGGSPYAVSPRGDGVAVHRRDGSASVPVPPSEKNFWEAVRIAAEAMVPRSS